LLCCNEASKKSQSAAEDLRYLQPTIYLEKKMGRGLGRSKVLQ
jgi:hypothetical protein